MSDTDPTALATAEVFNDIVKSRGGHAALSRWDIDVCAMVASITVAARTADVAAMIEHSENITKLMALLPAPTAEQQIPPLDLSVLTDGQLRILEHLQKIMLHEVAPDTPEPPWPPDPEPLGESERAGLEVGRWIDSHREEWRGRRLLSTEESFLRNAFQGMALGFNCKSLWREIYEGETRDLIERQIKSALAAVGSDAGVVPSTPQERRQLEPMLNDPPQEQASKAGLSDLLSIWPPFTSSDKPQ